jgi:hypothetical protein
MNTQKEKINASVIHILNFSYLEMMKSAFALAAQTEPWVTKGLKAPGYMFKTDELQIGCVDHILYLLGVNHRFLRSDYYMPKHQKLKSSLLLPNS